MVVAWAAQVTADTQSAMKAEVLITDGSPVPIAKYVVRDQTLTMTLPRGDDGARVGLFRLSLGPRDSLMDALSRLPAKAAGPPAVPGMSVVRIVGSDRGKALDLFSPWPTSDPAIDRLLRELGRRELLARDKPVIAISLAVQTIGPTQAKEPKTVTVRLAATGEKGAGATFDPGHIRVEAAPEPEPVPAGVTPLPPAWVSVGKPAAGARSLPAGTTAEVKLTVTPPSPAHRWYRALMEGDVAIRTREGESEVRVSLSAKPMRE